MIPLLEQAAAVEISAANLRGHIDHLAHLVAMKRRTQAEFEVAAGRLPALEAAAATLRWMVNNEANIRKVVA